jgi:MFS family permease
VTAVNPENSSPPSSSPSLLWRVLLVLATGLLVVWCGARVKPVLWFGLLFGGLTAAFGLVLARWLGERSRPLFAALCATAGCAAVFGLAVATLHRQRTAAPQDAVAAALIRSLEQAAADADMPAPMPPGGWQATASDWLAQRYQGLPLPGGWWCVGEVLSAGLVAGALLQLTGRRTPTPSQPTESAG